MSKLPFGKRITERITIGVLLAALADLAAAQTIPLPRPRPPLEGQTVPVPAPGGAASSLPTCRLQLIADKAIVSPVGGIAGPAGCGGVDLVRLEAVLSNKGHRIEIKPPAVLKCAMADAIANWIRDDLAELAERSFGSPLRSIESQASYQCRSRNNIAGGMISEHATGNAVDVGAITLVNGKRIDPTDKSVSRDFREHWKQQACARFTTVLGPGSDRYHEKHVHLDLRVRRNDYRICQWDN